MNASTPLWVTVLFTVLAPTLTLAGVVWTQRTADRRAEREAALRLRHEHEVARSDRLNSLYEEVIASCQTMLRDGSTPATYLSLYARALIIAPEQVQDALTAFWMELEAVEPIREKQDGTVDDVTPVSRHMIELIEAIRADTRKPLDGRAP